MNELQSKRKEKPEKWWQISGRVNNHHPDRKKNNIIINNNWVLFVLFPPLS